jgi:hypothetical protein
MHMPAGEALAVIKGKGFTTTWTVPLLLQLPVLPVNE